MNIHYSLITYDYGFIEQDPGPKTATVCSNSGFDVNVCCDWTADIQIMWCPEPDDEYYGPFFLYGLEPPPGCDMAYCAGSRQPCPPGQAYNPNAGPTDLLCIGMYIMYL